MTLFLTFNAYLADRDRTLDDITVEDGDLLWALYDNGIRNALALVSPQRDAYEWSDTVAYDVLVSLLGDDWVQDRIVGYKTCDLSKDYLNLGDDHISKDALRRHRIREFARRLYEFQSFSWFPDVLKNAATRDVGSVAFELDAMRLLMTASPAVETKPEISLKGRDFDCAAFINGRMVPVEAKSKSDFTPWTSNTIRNTVRSAATQLPKGQTGVLFIRVPFAWVSTRLEEEFTDALAEGSRQTSRIGAIISVIDKPSLSTGDPVKRFMSYFAADNCPDQIWAFCMRLRQFWDADLAYMAPKAPF